MKRVMLIVAYDGTNYCGWQIQPNGKTIEGEINKTLSEILKEKISIIGASRTDSGVHAMGNVAVFDTNSKMPAEKISYALNARLPEDIKIQQSLEVDSDFHPRRTESVKTYEYRILNRRFNIPMYRQYTYFYHYPLNVDKMREGAEYLVGKHDFKSFSTFNPQITDTVREIYELDIIKEEDIITIRVKGQGFLYNMVRIIAGTLIQVGGGNLLPEQIPKILQGCDRQLAGPTAPAQGLTLIKISYLKNSEKSQKNC